MSGSIVSRNREATVQHYATIAQEQRQHTASAAFLASQDNSSSSRNSKLSAGMRKSLQDLQRSLNCALCGNVTVRPVTLTCAHTFCCACIDVYSENNWVCPTCNVPFTMKSGDSFRNINAATQTIVNSWSQICHTLMRAEDGWWQGNDEDDDDEDEMEEEEDDDDGDDDAMDDFETAPEM